MRAITLVDEALAQFEREYQMPPRVILLPRKIFSQYEKEAATLASVLPPDTTGRRDDDPRWAEVRVIEHEGVKAPEVY